MNQSKTQWITGNYDHLYDQVKAGNRIVCYVDYDKELGIRDVCDIDPETMCLGVRGRSYGDPDFYIGPDMDEKAAFIYICEAQNVEWLCISNIDNILSDLLRSQDVEDGKELTDYYKNIERNNPTPTDKYRHFNHHHELTDDHELVDFGQGEFIANKVAIPLLKALNELGLHTRTHHVDDTGGFVSILLDKDIRVEIKHVHELDATRTKYNDRHEVLIMWNKPKPDECNPGKTGTKV